jgi:hypothetical protein
VNVALAALFVVEEVETKTVGMLRCAVSENFGRNEGSVFCSIKVVIVGVELQRQVLNTLQFTSKTFKGIVPLGDLVAILVDRCSKHESITLILQTIFQ